MSVDLDRDNLDEPQIGLRPPETYHHSQISDIPLHPVSTQSVPEVVAAESDNEHVAEDGEAHVEAIQRPGL